MSADLHLHTHYSDGNWSPQALIDAAVKLGFKCIAITDHDTVAALRESQLHAENKIRLINGIELNTIWKNPDGEFQDVHILGYFIDPQSLALEEIMARQQAARLDHLTETLARLQHCGYKIDLAQVKAEAGKGSIGRPHICQAMLKAGLSNDIQEAYRMLMNRDSKLRVIRRSVSPAEAIAAIAESGGVSSLAHPGKEAHIPLLLRELAACGLKAIEAYHRGHTLAMVRKYLRLAQKNNLLVTGGSDCHGPFQDYPASIGTIRLAPDLVQRLEHEHNKIKNVSIRSGTRKRANPD